MLSRQQLSQLMNASTSRIGIVTETIPRTNPVVAEIRPDASAFASFRPFTPNTMALIPTTAER
jgi:hypothetical protein